MIWMTSRSGADGALKFALAIIAADPATTELERMKNEYNINIDCAYAQGYMDGEKSKSPALPPSSSSQNPEASAAPAARSDSC